MLFVEVAHLILHLCVFSSNDRSFAIEMADLINYGVTVSKSVVILFLVQTMGSRANWPQYMNIDPSISQWRVADLTWPDLAWDENIEASLTSIYHVRARQWRCGLITMTEAGAWGIFTDLLGKRSGWINGLERKVLLATTGGGACEKCPVRHMVQTQSKKTGLCGLAAEMATGRTLATIHITSDEAPSFLALMLVRHSALFSCLFLDYKDELDQNIHTVTATSSVMTFVVKLFWRIRIREYVETII